MTLPTSSSENSPQSFYGPRWDNTVEYPSLHSPELQADISRIRFLTQELKTLCTPLSSELSRVEELSLDEGVLIVPIIQQATILHNEASILCSNVRAFCHGELSINGQNDAAKKLLAEMVSLRTELSQAYLPAEYLLRLFSEEILLIYLSHQDTAPSEFEVRHNRIWKERLLSLEEEDLLSGLAVNGIAAWGSLYTNISGKLQCTIQLPQGEQTVGITQATALLSDSDQQVREAAWRGIQNAWTTQEEPCVAVLNAITGWRQEVCKRRSKKVPTSFLFTPLHSNRIEQATLDALFEVLEEEKSVGQNALYTMASALKKERLGPWDLFAPAPLPNGAAQKYSFEEGMSLISEAFSSLHPEAGDFIRLMESNRWIEGTVGDFKLPGAYCTSFRKSRTPRVYMTYSGTMTDLFTLAHELGHAFHEWVMRELPYAQLSYPMTLAETASIFAETVLAEYLLITASNEAKRLPIVWMHGERAAAFLLNIPARFMFEHQFNEAREKGILSANECKDLMSNAWKHWYGDSLSEMDRMFWASKLHFHMSHTSFYNFPYTFGYLFSLGVYAQREKLGDQFYPFYVSLLQDTGRMTAEDLVQKHLGINLTQKSFWRDAVTMVKSQIEQFGAVVKNLHGDCTRS